MLAQISLGKGEHLKHLLIIRLDVRDEKDVVRVCVSMLILLFNCQTPLFLSRPVATNIMSKNSHRLQTHETVILFLCYDGCRGSGQGAARSKRLSNSHTRKKKTQPHGTFYKHDSLFDMFQAISLS